MTTEQMLAALTADLTIPVAKLGKNVELPFSKWSLAAQRNALVVGVGRIIADAHAGVIRKDYPDHESHRKVVYDRIDTRVRNLEKADVRSVTPAEALVRENAELKAMVAELMAAANAAKKKAA